MNCDAVREKLIDLVYDELPAAERPAVEEHLSACPACREELEALRFARSAVAEHAAGEPAPAYFDVAAGRAVPVPTAMAAVPSSRRWLPAAAAVAAAAVLAVGVWVVHNAFVGTAVAEAGPVVIERLGVSLTILSQPEGWQDSPYDQTAMQQADVQMRQTERSVQTFYVPAQRGGGRPVWRGLALVRDQRLIRRLPAGVSRVRFTNVPSGILPDSVRLRSLDRPDAMSILEQNYQYDLASAEAVLRKHIDKPIRVVFKDDRTVEGTLLSFDGGTLVIRPEGAGPRNVSRKDIRGVTFAKLPKGLLSRPTLVWELVNRAATRQQFEVAYLTGGLQWRADYVLKLRPGRMRAEKARGEGIADIIDLADLVGYATVNNFSGVTYKDAQLKLMAGDVNLIKPPGGVRRLDRLGGRARAFADSGRAVMTEKSFFEYHLYTVTRPTTIRNAETKQLEMVSGSGLKLSRGYVYNPNANKTAARVVSELMNSKANGLGKPLPKGVIRLYAPDPTGFQTYVAKTTIDHTPTDEKLRLPWGHAFDIVCSAKRTHYTRRGTDQEATWQYQIRNHKDYDVNVTVMVTVPNSTYTATCNGYLWHVRQVGLVEIDVPVEADKVVDVSFTYKWDPTSGGGLSSPHDGKKSDRR